jgi:hypothetical protein
MPETVWLRDPVHLYSEGKHDKIKNRIAAILRQLMSEA